MNSQKINSKFTGKFAIVAGGTRGIGKAISLHLAKEGATVLALYARNREAAKELETEAAALNLKIHTIRGDLTHPEKAKEVFDQIKALAPQIDFLVHCAASGVHRPAFELTEKHFKWTFDINVFAIHSLIKELLPLFKNGSRIIGVTSSGGTRVIPFYTAVGSSKGALESLFRHYAYELAPLGIAVNLVCPGLVLTEAVDAFPDKENRIQKSIDATPTKELTRPEDVAYVIEFLCLPTTRQIIGQTIVIDGGKTLLS
jgi:enoyl-[acyl-carrier protein] reductase III